MLKKCILVSLGFCLIFFSCAPPEVPTPSQPPAGATGKILLIFKAPVKESKGSDIRSFLDGYDLVKVVVSNASFIKDVTLDGSNLMYTPFVPVEFVVPVGSYTVEVGAYMYGSAHAPMTFGFDQYGYSENVIVEPGGNTNVKIVGFEPHVTLTIQDLDGNNLTELVGGQTIRVRAGRGNMPAFINASHMSFHLFVGSLFHVNDTPEDYLFNAAPITFDSFTTLTVPQTTIVKTCVSIVAVSFNHFSDWPNYSYQPTLNVNPPTGTIYVTIE